MNSSLSQSRLTALFVDIMANNYSFQEPVEDLQRQEEKNRVQKELSKTEKKQTRVIERSTKYQLTLEPAIFLSTLADYLQVGVNFTLVLYFDFNYLIGPFF